MAGFGNEFKSKKQNPKTKLDRKKEKIVHQAFLLHSQGKIKEALKNYKYCIDIGVNDDKIYSNYGGILQGLGKLREAANCYRKAIELNSNSSDAYSNLGIILKSLGKLREAANCYRKAIELKPDLAIAHSNLGNILIDLGKLQEAELSYRKAIDLNPNSANAHYNLGNLFSDQGKLQEAELSYRKAIDLNPNSAKAYYSLSKLTYSDEYELWKKNLFSKNILNKKSKEHQIDIYFARANVLHKEKNFKDSSKFLKLANQLKLIVHPSNSDSLITKSRKLLDDSMKVAINQKEYIKSPESIFIVGMPRSGSTLLESILSMNAKVDDLGESSILEKLLQEINPKLSLAERYWEKIRDHNKQSIKTTNKNLYNYLYVGIIANNIPNSKIINCFRNPLDNILSIYRANFATGNQYSSSLIDCAKVYLNQEKVMNEYKKKFPKKIYDLNYDSLVSNTNQEIKSLISWLGWQWDDKFLSPHLSKRSVSTASNIQVRSPINSKSVGGWKNYKDMLKPAMEIIVKEEKYKNLKY